MAAEEVFAKARDRVNRMGGVGAMRERERNSGWGKWEEERKDEREDRGEGLVEEREGDGQEDEREEGVRKVEVGGGDDDEVSVHCVLYPRDFANGGRWP